MKVFLACLVLAVASSVASAAALEDILLPKEVPEIVQPKQLDEIVPSNEFVEVIHPKDLPQSNNIEGRITNGYNAGEGQAPYTVGLGFSGGWWCGGSIIGHNWILTAEHCTGNAEAVTIYFGATWRTNAVFTHWVHRNDFINHHNADIALIRISHVDFWHQVNRVELPSYNDRYNDFNGWYTTACGWGGTYDGSPLPDWLQCVDLEIMSNNECRQTYGAGTVGDNILCVRTPNGRSTCGGDSGGPLVLHAVHKLVGVTNWVSSAGCQSGHPSGFQRVTYHLDWIRDHTGIAYY